MQKTIYTSVITLFLVFALNVAQAQESGIRFETSNWEQIQAEAKEEGKLIFLDAYASWCGPCKWMDKNVFTNEEVAGYFNNSFVNAKIDMEKGEGPSLAEKYGVRNYPTFLWVDAEGNLVHRVCGSRKVEDFIKVAETASEGEMTLGAFTEAFKDDLENSNVASTYFTLLSDACMSSNGAATKYLATVEEKELIEEGNWSIIKEYVNDPNSREFKYVVANADQFAEKYADDDVPGKIYKTYLTGGVNLVRAKDFDAKKVSTYLESLEQTGFERAEEVKLRVELYMAKRQGNWEVYATNAANLVNNFGDIENANTLNSYAWTFYESVKDEAMLKKAEGWARTAVDMEGKHYIMDTHAAVLYKLGKYDEALKIEERALKMATEAGENTDDYLKMIDKITAAKLKQ